MRPVCIAARPGRATRLGIKREKRHAFTGKAVDIGRRHAASFTAPIGAEVPVAGVIGDQEEDVGLPLLRRMPGRLASKLPLRRAVAEQNKNDNTSNDPWQTPSCCELILPKRNSRSQFALSIRENSIASQAVGTPAYDLVLCELVREIGEVGCGGHSSCFVNELTVEAAEILLEKIS